MNVGNVSDEERDRREAMVTVDGVTLDGRPAVVQGFRMNFAQVRTTMPPYISGEWAWDTVERIISNGGAFKL